MPVEQAVAVMDAAGSAVGGGGMRGQRRVSWSAEVDQRGGKPPVSRCKLSTLDPGLKAPPPPGFQTLIGKNDTTVLST